MHQSLWENSAERKHFEKLAGDIKTDVLIIGGGISGILCAYMLQNAGVDYCLAESEEICGKTTLNTTAKITVLHGLVYHKLIKSLGKERAQMYLLANQKALEEYERICEKIPCDFEKKSAVTYSLCDRKKIEKEVEALGTLGCNAQFYEKLPLPLRIQGAVEVKNQAQFNPIAFLSQISKNLKIYEHTKVKELVGTTAVTSEGNIKAKKIIVATHFPFLNKHGAYYLKMYQSRSYVTAFENAPLYPAMYVDEAEKGLSFRTYRNMLLIGSGGQRTGKKNRAWNEGLEFAKVHYPYSKPVYSWATQDCMTLDGSSYIGRYSKSTPDLYVATGYNKWGMTGSMAAAMILRDMVLEKENPYAEAFNPSRSMLKPQLLLNGFEAAVSLLTPTKKRCPHLGCALKYNKAEHSWDCPCHGSRFEKDGKLLDGPATGDITT